MRCVRGQVAHHGDSVVSSTTCFACPAPRTFGSLVRLLPPWASAAFCAATLVACSGAEHAPAPDAELGASTPGATPSAPRGGVTPSQTVSITETAAAGEGGLLDVLAIGAMEQSLGSLEFTVRDRTGTVLSTGFNEVQGRDVDRRLLLNLPSGKDYELALDSSEFGCHAEVGPFTVEAHSTANYQAYLWQCDQPPAAPADECYWLADWVGASRTRAAVGESIVLSVVGKDTSGVAAHITWTNLAPRFGSISEPHASTTTFTCDAASDSIPLGVVITGDGCSRRLSVDVSCSAE
jgi:hypothetical protein